MATTTMKVFRYKLDDSIIQLINYFAKIHEYDDRHTYKEAWQQWLVEERELIEREINRLQQLGFTGDVEDKMFQAGRYYFRGKKDTAIKVDGGVKMKRDYCSMTPELIQAMDDHLKGIMLEPTFKPATGYTQFCQQNIDLLRTEIGRLINTLTGDKIADKFKKSYKNRYFILQRSVLQNSTAAAAALPATR